MKPNQSIRDLIKKSPLKSYEVAQALGYSSGSALSAKLQTELSEKDKQYFIQKIKELSEDKIDDSLSRIKFESKYIRNRKDINESYISRILKEINQLRLEVEQASTKEDFERISKLSEQISKTI